MRSVYVFVVFIPWGSLLSTVFGIHSAWNWSSVDIGILLNVGAINTSRITQLKILHEDK